MRTSGRILALAAAGLIGGCRSAPPPTAAPPPGSPPPLELAVGPGASLEPDIRSLPKLDAAALAAEDIAPAATAFRLLGEEDCRREAAARAPLPALAPAGDCRAWREHPIAEARNRAAADALDAYFRLADAEGRGEIVRAGLPTLDRLRAGVADARANGVRVPADPADLDRQRASLLAVLGQADLGATLLDIDLKRRVGVPGKTAERLRPAGPFPPVAAPPADRDAMVRTALETRPDLRLLRAAYLGLTPDTLPAVRALVRDAGSPADIIAKVITDKPARRRDADQAAADAAELNVRRAQLTDLVTRRERQAADEVRGAAATLAAQTAQVGLARWRLDQVRAKQAAGPDPGPLARLATDLDDARARADVVAAVMAWHQARIKLLAAQGLLAGP